jgi:hypothetical protein
VPRPGHGGPQRAGPCGRGGAVAPFRLQRQQHLAVGGVGEPLLRDRRPQHIRASCSGSSRWFVATATWRAGRGRRGGPGGCRWRSPRVRPARARSAPPAPRRVAPGHCGHGPPRCGQTESTPSGAGRPAAVRERLASSGGDGTHRRDAGDCPCSVREQPPTPSHSDRERTSSLLKFSGVVGASRSLFPSLPDS